MPPVSGPQWPRLSPGRWGRSSPAPGGAHLSRGSHVRGPRHTGVPGNTRPAGFHAELLAALLETPPGPGRGLAAVTFLSRPQAPGRLTTTSSVVGTHSAGACHPAAWRTPRTGPACGGLWPFERATPVPELPPVPGVHPGLTGPRASLAASAGHTEAFIPMWKSDFEVILLLPASSPSIATTPRPQKGLEASFPLSGWSHSDRSS